MKAKNSELNRFYRDVKKNLLGGYKFKKRIIDDIRAKVSDFLADNPNATAYTVEKHFGTPQAIAEGFNAALTADELKQEKLNKTLKCIIFILLALALLAVIIVAVYIIANANKDSIVYIGDSIDNYVIT